MSIFSSSKRRSALRKSFTAWWRFAVVRAAVISAKAEVEGAAAKADEQAAPGDVRVTYVPEVVRQEITAP